MSRTNGRQPDSPAAPAPAPELTPEPDPTPREGRDEGGRFTKNNRGGPGNPFARRTAAFRRALAEAVSDEMIVAVVRKLAELAQAGDVAAIKLFLAYTVGKPGPAVNPDTLDVEEHRLYQQEQVDPVALARMATRPSLDFLLETVRTVRPGMDQACAQHLVERLDDMAEADREAAAETAQESVEDAAMPDAREDTAAEPGPEESHRGHTMSRKDEEPCGQAAQPARKGNAKPAPSPNGEIRARRPHERGQEMSRRDNPDRQPDGVRPPAARRGSP